jgi:hypothetical protein
MNQQSNVCFMDGIIAADNLDDNLPEMRRNALTQITKQFTATHVFERVSRSFWPKDQDEVLQLWEQVFKRRYVDCATSISELREVKTTNRTLYDSSMERFYSEIEHNIREYDANYAKGIFISYIPVLSLNERVNILMGNSHVQGTDKIETMVELANLVSFGGKIYAKNSNGGPIETIQYQHPKKYNLNNKDIGNAIAALTTLILNP